MSNIGLFKFVPKNQWHEESKVCNEDVMDSRCCRPMMVGSEDCLEWRMCSGNGFTTLQYINI